jgi:hypothetical protein
MSHFNSTIERRERERERERERGTKGEGSRKKG